MGLLIECPECKKRNGLKVKINGKPGEPRKTVPRKFCDCGFALAKCTGRVYWIEYYLDGQRKRERIGPNKAAAEQRLGEVLTARTEGGLSRKAPMPGPCLRSWRLGILNCRK
jgi:hypothetical protein